MFRDDSPQVQKEWENYVEKIDSMVEEALRQTIKISLQELARAVGDGKSEVLPFLQVLLLYYSYVTKYSLKCQHK